MRKRLLLATFIIIAIFPAGLSIAGSAEGAKNVSVAGMKGNVEVMVKGSSVWVPAASGMLLGSGDTIRTAQGAYVDLDFGPRQQAAVVRVSETTTLKIDTYIASENIENRKITLDVAVGEILVKVNKVKNESQFQVRTPTSIVGVRGTMFKVSVSPAQ